MDGPLPGRTSIGVSSLEWKVLSESRTQLIEVRWADNIVGIEVEQFIEGGIATSLAEAGAELVEFRNAHCTIADVSPKKR